VKNLTPSHMRCVYAAACPSVHELDDGRLLIVGMESHEEAQKCGAGWSDGETAIIIDRALLANVHAEAIASLQGEVGRLNAAVTDTIGMIRDWAAAEGFPVESSACFQRLSAALSQHPGEGEKA
jgi:hypothetical protein